MLMPGTVPAPVPRPGPVAEPGPLPVPAPVAVPPLGPVALLGPEPLPEPAPPFGPEALPGFVPCPAVGLVPWPEELGRVTVPVEFVPEDVPPDGAVPVAVFGPVALLDVADAVDAEVPVFPTPSASVVRAGRCVT